MIIPQLATEILALSGIVVPITQAIKKWLKVEGTTALIISAIVTVLLSLWRTLSVQPYDWAKLIMLGGSVFRGERDLSFWLLCCGEDGEEGRVKDVRENRLGEHPCSPRGKAA